MSLANFGESSIADWLNSSGFVNVRGVDLYHSSTTQAQYKDPFKPESYYLVSMSLPAIREFGKGSIDYTWAVRGTSSGPAAVPTTGQNTCYDVAGNVIPCAGTGQDGELQAGVAWPAPRFRSNGDGTVADELTGLTWLVDANCAKTVGASSDGKLTWQEALTFVDSITGSFSEWRLPNAVEMRSLHNGQVKDAAAWLNSQGFKNTVADTYYWTSTSRGGRC